jgi:hypothetical protein
MNMDIDGIFHKKKKANIWPMHLQLLVTIWFLQLIFCLQWLVWHHANINRLTYD